MKRKEIECEDNKCCWYNNNIEKLSKKLWMPQNEYFEYNTINSIPFEISCDGLINNDYNLNFKKIQKLDKQEEANKIKESYEKSIKKLLESKSDNKNIRLKELKTKYEKKVNNIGKIIKSKMFYLQFSNEQHKIIQKWMYECTKVYNKCVELYNKDSKTFSLDYTVSKLLVFKILYGNNDKGCPYDILTDEVRAFCSNVKSCFSNLYNGNIETFKMKNKNISSSQSVLIPKTSISQKGIYTKILGSIDTFKDIENFDVSCDSRLVYDVIYKKYYLYIPQYYEIKNIINRKPIVALDPGEKVFQAFYGIDECGKIGNDMRIKILYYQTKIKKFQTVLSNNENKKGNIIKYKKNLRKKIIKFYRKIKNIVKELHNQTCNFLCKNYDTILIPKFETQSMIGKRFIKKTVKEILSKGGDTKKEIKEFSKKCRLSKRVKFVLNNLSHYKFRQQLLNKSKEYGCNLIVVTEEYTSQCCGECGKLSKNYIDRVKKCSHCNTMIDRDINGARNILLKNYKEVLKI